MVKYGATFYGIHNLLTTLLQKKTGLSPPISFPTDSSKSVPLLQFSGFIRGFFFFFFFFFFAKERNVAFPRHIFFYFCI